VSTCIGIIWVSHGRIRSRFVQGDHSPLPPFFCGILHYFKGVTKISSSWVKATSRQGINHSFSAVTNYLCLNFIFVGWNSLKMEETVSLIQTCFMLRYSLAHCRIVSKFFCNCKRCPEQGSNDPPGCLGQVDYKLYLPGCVTCLNLTGPKGWGVQANHLVPINNI